jgi:hypothetical protein
MTERDDSPAARWERRDRRREHLSGLEIENLGSMTGELMVSRARERVLEAAHHWPATGGRRRRGTARQVAEACGTEPEATGKLLFALAGAGYLKAADGSYKLTRLSRKWLLSGGKASLRDKLLLQFEEWDFLARTGEYLSSGEPLELHGGLLDDAGQEAYQRGMRSMAGALSWELIRRFPVPEGARDMLDIGGSHGHYSCELCRRHPGLRATVLDLPEAVAHAAPLLAGEKLGDRVVHRAGDALTDDLGEAA